MKKYFLFIAFISLISFANAQQNSFSKVLMDSSGYTQAYSIIKTTDNNYMIVGSDNGALVLKIDTVGNIIWDKNFGNYYNENFRSIIVTRDSCCVLIGNVYNPIDSLSDIFCVKINLNGDTLWTREINMGYNDYTLAIQQTFDNGFILAGYSSQNISPLSMITVVKLDANGNLVWGKTFTGGNYNNIAYTVKQMPDSGYVVTGYVDSMSSDFQQRAFLMKLTSIGNIAWSKINITSKPYYYSSVWDVTITAGGLLCYIEHYSGDIIMKTDFTGNVLWSKLMYNPENTAINSSSLKLRHTNDGGYVFISDYSVLRKIDSVGNPSWSNRYWLNTINDIVESKDKGFMVLGNGPMETTKKLNNIPGEIAIIKTDSLGISSTCHAGSVTLTSTAYPINLSTISFISATAGTMISSHPLIVNPLLTERNGCVDVVGSIQEDKDKENAIQVYPNPAMETSIIKWDKAFQFSTLEIYDVIGTSVLKTNVSNLLSFTIDGGLYTKGIYFIKLSDNNGNNITKKLIIL